MGLPRKQDTENVDMSAPIEAGVINGEVLDAEPSQEQVVVKPAAVSQPVQAQAVKVEVQPAANEVVVQPQTQTALAMPRKAANLSALSEFEGLIGPDDMASIAFNTVSKIKTSQKGLQITHLDGTVETVGKLKVGLISYSISKRILPKGVDANATKDIIKSMATSYDLVHVSRGEGMRIEDYVEYLKKEVKGCIGADVKDYMDMVVTVYATAKSEEKVNPDDKATQWVDLEEPYMAYVQIPPTSIQQWRGHRMQLSMKMRTGTVSLEENQEYVFTLKSPAKTKDGGTYSNISFDFS